MNRPKYLVALWTLYDFANSMAAGVFGVYLAQWLVVDHHVSDIKFNSIFVVSSFLLLLSAPILGVIADRRQEKLPALRFITIFSFLSLVVIAILAQLFEPTNWVVNAVIVFLIVGQYFYQLSYVFYNPLLKQLTHNESEQAKYSGYAQAASGLGQIFGLLVTLPLATGAIYLLGHRNESQVFLPTAILFLLLTLPMLLLFREQTRPQPEATIDVVKELQGVGQHLKELGRYPGVHRFLLGYFLFNDTRSAASGVMAISYR